MGIPSFFRWVTERYPQCSKEALEAALGENLVKANPNGECDNLYIDMNDILHRACHPEDAKTPESFKETMETLSFLIEQQVRICRPRNMLYLAFDGVAPKAKLAVQRRRRFACHYNAFKSQKNTQLLAIYRKEQGLPSEGQAPKVAWNSNAISPGTQFMMDCSKWIAEWVQKKQLEESFWTGLYIIVSDAFTPGEGEHKIVQHIRRMRQQPAYNPKTRHVIAGRDADLILLALGTHEPNCRILRETSYFGKQIRCPMCFGQGHCRDCIYPPIELPDRPVIDYTFFDINTFRTVLMVDLLRSSESVPEINLENILNDFILITFLLGNDFLPKLPGISIRSGGLDLLVEVYTTHLVVRKEPLTNEKGEIKPECFQHFLSLLSGREADLITQEFRINRRSVKALKKRKHKKSKHEEDAITITEDQQQENEQECRERLENLFPCGSFELTSIPWFNSLTLEQQARYIDLTMYIVPPRLRQGKLKTPYDLHWKRNYYQVRFDVKLPKSVAKNKSYTANTDIRKLLNDYMKGIVWCFQYYTRINPDWDYFYPYYYAPCLSDLSRCMIKNVDFNPTKPLCPLLALLSIIPVVDADLLPSSLQAALNNPDSPISDLYPSRCEVDYSEAYVFWQGIWDLPFMDFNRLISYVTPYLKDVSQVEGRLNVTTKPRVFVSSVTDLGSNLLKFYGDPSEEVSCIFGASEVAEILSVEEEFSVNCQHVIPIEGYTPACKEKNPFSSVCAYMEPLPIEDFSMKLLPDAVTEFRNVASEMPTNHHRRFGTLRKFWYKILAEQRMRLVKEAQVFGYANIPKDHSVLNKRDPSRQKYSMKQQSSHPIQMQVPQGKNMHFDRMNVGHQHMNNPQQTSQYMDMMKMQKQHKLVQNIAQLAGNDVSMLQAMVNVLQMQGSPHKQMGSPTYQHQFGFPGASSPTQNMGNDMVNNLHMMMLQQQMSAGAKNPMNPVGQTNDEQHFQQQGRTLNLRAVNAMNDLMHQGQVNQPQQQMTMQNQMGMHQMGMQHMGLQSPMAMQNQMGMAPPLGLQAPVAGNQSYFPEQHGMQQNSFGVDQTQVMGNGFMEKSNTSSPQIFSKNMPQLVAKPNAAQNPQPAGSDYQETTHVEGQPNESAGEETNVAAPGQNNMYGYQQQQFAQTPDAQQFNGLNGMNPSFQQSQMGFAFPPGPGRFKPQFPNPNQQFQQFQQQGFGNKTPFQQQFPAGGFGNTAGGQFSPNYYMQPQGMNKGYMNNPQAFYG